jgi:hypothetical protein
MTQHRSAPRRSCSDSGDGAAGRAAGAGPGRMRHTARGTHFSIYIAPPAPKRCIALRTGPPANVSHGSRHPRSVACVSVVGAALLALPWFTSNASPGPALVTPSHSESLHVTPSHSESLRVTPCAYALRAAVARHSRHVYGSPCRPASRSALLRVGGRAPVQSPASASQAAPVHSGQRTRRPNTLHIRG